MDAGHDWIDVDRLFEAGWIGSCEVLNVVDSSNTFALQRASQVQERDLPLLVIARRQVAGRGRGANVWWSDQGSLTCSLLLAPSSFELSRAQWPTLSVLAGSAVCTALTQFTRDTPTRLKWPNDVFLRSRKVGGILVEASSTSEDRVVVGIGINVNNSFQNSPQSLAEIGISLKDAAGSEIDCLGVLTAVLEQLRRDLERLKLHDDELINSWRNQCLLTGRQVVLDNHDRRIEGTCLGIDDDGALRLQTSFGPQRVMSGVVAEFS